MLSALPGKEQDELETLQTDFDRFRSMFDRGISVQTVTIANNLSSHLEDLVKQFTELGTFMQAVFEQFLLTLSISTGKRGQQCPQRPQYKASNPGASLSRRYTEGSYCISTTLC